MRPEVKNKIEQMLLDLDPIVKKDSKYRITLDLLISHYDKRGSLSFQKCSSLNYIHRIYFMPAGEKIYE